MRNLVIVSMIVALGWLSVVHALDKSIYPGCRVVDQVAGKLIIQLDRELLTGTDAACEAAQALIEKIERSGYDVCIQSDNNQWIPAVAEVCHN